jgi:hypothetical protein
MKTTQTKEHARQFLSLCARYHESMDRFMRAVDRPVTDPSFVATSQHRANLLRFSEKVNFIASNICKFYHESSELHDDVLQRLADVYKWPLHHVSLDSQCWPRIGGAVMPFEAFVKALEHACARHIRES